jgi:hypothetical protein
MTIQPSDSHIYVPAARADLAVLRKERREGRKR